jgi:succinyldiaminopimelate transaminase
VATVGIVKLNPVLESLGTYPIATVRERAAERERLGLPVVDFSIGDPREPTPEFIVDALVASVPEVSQYPTAAGLPKLREAVANYVERRFGVQVDPGSQIIPTSGSKESIFSTPFAFIGSDAGDGVVFPSPGYPVYERGAAFAGAVLDRVVLGEDFILRADDITDEMWGRARLVWTCTPHNPSGSVTDRTDLEDLYERCRAEDALLLSDECYADVYEEDAYPDGPPSLLQVAGSSMDGALVYLSLSKRSGMTGYRSGAIVGDAIAISALKQLRSTTGTASPNFIQGAAIAAWSDDEHAERRRHTFTAKREILARAFTDSGMDVIASRAGLYLWIKVDDDIGTTNVLLEHGIVVSPGRFFGPGGEGFIRLALVPTLEECAQAANALTKALG